MWLQNSCAGWRAWLWVRAWCDLPSAKLTSSSKTSLSVWFHINWMCSQRLVENRWGLDLVWQHRAKSILAFLAVVFWLLRSSLNHLIWLDDWILKKRKKKKKASRKWDHFNSYQVVGYRISKCPCVTDWCMAGSLASPEGEKATGQIMILVMLLQD